MHRDMRSGGNHDHQTQPICIARPRVHHTQQPTEAKILAIRGGPRILHSSCDKMSDYCYVISEWMLECTPGSPAVYYIFQLSTNMEL